MICPPSRRVKTPAAQERLSAAALPSLNRKIRANGSNFGYPSPQKWSLVRYFEPSATLPTMRHGLAAGGSMVIAGTL